jgi:hypothetical protein
MGLSNTTGGITYLNLKEGKFARKSANGDIELFDAVDGKITSIEFQDDVAASAIDSKLWALLGTVVAFTVKKETGNISASNPEYQGSVLVKSHSFGGDVGSLAMKSLTWPTKALKRSPYSDKTSTLIAAPWRLVGKLPTLPLCWNMCTRFQALSVSAIPPRTPRK